MTKLETLTPNTIYDVEELKCYVFNYALDLIPDFMINIKMIIQGLTDKIKVYLTKHGLLLVNKKIFCPHCGSKYYKKDGITPRLLRFFNEDRANVNLQRYKCKRCNKRFQTDLTSIIDRNDNISHEMNKKIKTHIIENETSLHKTKFSLFENHNINVSHQTVENLILEYAEPKELSLGERLDCEGYLIFDTEWIKKMGEWVYRFALMDSVKREIIAEAIYPEENAENLNKFFDKALSSINVKCITTDLNKTYTSIFTKRGIEQQYCLFHTKKIIEEYIDSIKSKYEKRAEKIEKKLDKINNEEIQKKLEETRNEIQKYQELTNELYEILDNEDYEESREKLRELNEKIDEYEGKIVNFVKNRLTPEFKLFKRWTEDEKIQKTSNMLENMFQKTMNGSKKRKYKTNPGIMSRIHMNEIRVEKDRKRRKYYKRKKETKKIEHKPYINNKISIQHYKNKKQKSSNILQNVNTTNNLMINVEV